MDTFNLLLLIWTFIALFVMILLLKIPAPYGRYASRSWGPILNNRLSWLLMEAPSLVIPLYFLKFICPGNLNFAVLLLILLWVVHYFYRSLIFPFLLRHKRNMPLSVVLMGASFNVINSLFNMYYLTKRASFHPSWVRDPRFIFGLMVFVAGFLSHFESDRILRGLRSKSEGDYQIPKGWLFEYVSCPNYFGEILEWTGWAIASWSLAGLSFAIWTFANLAPRALSYHRWYKENFEDYPENRRALIPYLI
ncbi:MAG: DUF1295 domain-containing protein [Candidatus Hydrothermia bacterium]